MPKRKYSAAYIKYGFIAIEHNGEALPQCVVCMKTLANPAMKPSLLQRHLDTNHPDKKDRNRVTFSDSARMPSSSAWTRLAQSTRERRGLSRHPMKSLS